jgi:hypothetical protein
VSQWAALLQYHFKVDPDTLSDEDFATYVGRLKFALKTTGQWGK